MKDVLFFILIVIILGACAKRPINGKLDGRWQLMTIDYHEDGMQIKPEYTYYNIQLHVIQLKQTHGEEIEIGGIFGRFNYTNDSLHIKMINSTREAVECFGMNDTIQHFSVEVLTKKRMELNSLFARLCFEKF